MCKKRLKNDYPFYEIDMPEALEPDPKDIETARIVEHYRKKGEEYDRKTEELKNNGSRLKLLIFGT